MKRIAVTMTTIYGRTRLQVTCDGEHIGWVDLHLGVTVIERPDMAAEIDQAVGEWFDVHGRPPAVASMRPGAA
jgi:hypothetical protein